LFYRAKKITLKQIDRLRIELIGAQGTLFTESRYVGSMIKRQKKMGFFSMKKKGKKVKKGKCHGRCASKGCKSSKVKKMMKLAKSGKKKKKR